MNLKIIETKENLLFKRKELVVKIGSEGPTPKESELIDKLSAILDSKNELFSVKTIKQKFGSRESIAIVNHYESVEDLKRTERKKKGSEEKKSEELPENVPDESGQIKVDLDEPSEEKPDKQSEESKPKEEKKPDEKKEEKKPEEKKEEKKEEKSEEKEETKD